MAREKSDSTPPFGYEAMKDLSPEEMMRKIIGLKAELSVTRSDLRRAEAVIAANREHDRRKRGEAELRAQILADTCFDLAGLLSQVTHQSFAAHLICDTRGQVIYGNMASEVLFGDLTGVDVFRNVLGRLSRRVAPTPTDKSGINENPLQFGYGFWERVVIKERVRCMQERVLLHSPIMSGAKHDVHFIIQTLEHGGRRYVTLEITDIEAILKDKLSGLFLQDVGQNALDRAIAQLTREPDLIEVQPLSFIFFDIDDFKRFNEKYGYDAGDKVIREVANVIMSIIRATDLACRWFSGDEFGVIIRGGDASKLTRRIVDAIEQIAIIWPGSEDPLEVRVTTGKATWKLGQTREELVEEAKSFAKKTPANKGRITEEMSVKDIVGPETAYGTLPHRR